MGAAVDHERHFAAERLRLLDVMAALLRRQRARGRTTAADALAGMVIEDGEAEGLIAQLGEAWGARAPGTQAQTSSADSRARISRDADAATASGVPLPLWRARRMFVLHEDEYDALVLALIVECDARAGRLVAYLNDHPGQPRPTVGLAQALADVQGVDCDPLGWSGRPILADGLLTLSGQGPIPTRVLELDTVQARRLTTLDTAPEPGVRVSVPDPRLLGRLVLPESTRIGIEGWAQDIRDGGGMPVVAITGPPGSGRTTLTRAAAGVAGRALVECDATADNLAGALRMLRREARWYAAAMAVCFGGDAAVDPRAFWEAVAIPHDLLFLDAPEPVVAGLLATAPVEPSLWRCQLPGTSDRIRMWNKALPPGVRLDDADAEALAGAFRFGPAAIGRAVRRADAERGTGALDRSTLARAAREQVGQALGRLADRLPQPYGRTDLVLPAETDAELDLALHWIRHQAQVLDRWGLGARVASGRGLTALFAGPPGTGKTMAAQVLSRELELDCYRIDLSRVISKYIGETEQNLAKVFDEAEAGGAVLFFDEADALFGKRSEVRDARDRYANLEVGYLLQRMEQYEGVAVLASNRMADMDEAFLRRFQVVARFRLPLADERRRIWSGLLPPECDRANDIDLAALAEAVELSGGEIKNCVLAAAYLAAGEGASLRMVHLVAAVRRELGKSGRLVDEAALEGLVTE
jgi:ATPase family associated with various cellular activities (AAA)/Winged helix domain, variant